MSLAGFHATLTCRSEVHCKSCRFDDKWRARIGARFGLNGAVPWRCRKDPAQESNAASDMAPAPAFMEPTIPRIMHFVWVQGEPPDWAKAIMAYWQRMNPHYKLMLHDESAVAPEHQHIFDTVLTDRTNKNHIVSKADIIRVDVLRQYGGWHIDMDFMPLATLDEIWRAFQPQDFMCLRHWRRDTLCNGLMAGTTDARIWEPLMGEWGNGAYNGDLNYYSTVCLERLRKHPAMFFPKSPSHFFPPSYREGSPCIKLAEDMLSGESTMAKIRRHLSCCGAPKPYTFHIGLRGGDKLNLRKEALSAMVAPAAPPRVYHHLRAASVVAAPALASFDAKQESYAVLRQHMKDPDKNAMIWGGNFSKAERDSFKANILYFENGLIQQSHGCYVDGRGYFGESSIRHERLWDTEPSCAEAVVAQYKRLALQWGIGGNPGGPIIIALQHRHDTGPYRYFPLRGAEQDSFVSVLTLCAKYLPDKPVIVRPHPRFRTQWEERAEEYQKLMRPGWTVNMEGSIYPMLTKASALVTVNSTVTVEAMAVAIPIAALGEGVWTDSGAVIDCHQNPARLAELFYHAPEMGARMRVASAIFKRQVPYSQPSLLARHPAYIEWLARCRR